MMFADCVPKIRTSGFVLRALCGGVRGMTTSGCVLLELFGGVRGMNTSEATLFLEFISLVATKTSWWTFILPLLPVKFATCISPSMKSVGATVSVDPVKGTRGPDISLTTVAAAAEVRRMTGTATFSLCTTRS